MEHRVTIRWTNTAKEQLAALPLKVRQGILAKANHLRECDDPRSAHKPLVGPLQGFYRLTYARYRAVYRVEDERLASGDVLVHIHVCFVAAGRRKERDRKDIYRIAEKMINFDLVDFAAEEDTEGS